MILLKRPALLQPTLGILDHPSALKIPSWDWNSTDPWFYLPNLLKVFAPWMEAVKKSKKGGRGGRAAEWSIGENMVFQYVKQYFVAFGLSLHFCHVLTAPFSVWSPHASSKKGTKGELHISGGRGEHCCKSQLLQFSALLQCHHPQLI